MKDLNKINSAHLYGLWKNLTIVLMIFMVLVSCTKLLPFYLAPVLGLGGAAAVYTLLYNGSIRRINESSIILYCAFYCLISYCIVGIGINVLYAYGELVVPKELIFFNDPYIVSLVLMPVSFVVMLFLTIRRKNLLISRECRRVNGDRLERCLSGILLERETKVQMWNLTILFGILSVVIWYYFLFSYSDINQNGRDNYVFIWLVLISFLIDELYFVFRFVNLYLDLKEADELITPEELSRKGARTYLRFYVLCGDKVWLNPHSVDPATPYREVLDTPLQSKRTVNGITIDEVREIAAHLTGVSNGELRFFFGRKRGENNETSLLRYFYTLPGNPENYPKLKADGEWVNFDELKKTYALNPGNLATLLAADMNRLATITITSKKYNPDGTRRHVLKSYQPPFSIADIRNNSIDYQDDLWMKVASFNADTPFYHMKKMWYRIKGENV